MKSLTRQSKTVEYGAYSVSVAEATALQGMRHTILKDDMISRVSEDDDPALIYLKRIFYPALISAVVEHSGFEFWPISFEEFLKLPDSFVVEWERATYDLNPHWQPGYQPAKPEEKKEPISD